MLPKFPEFTTLDISHKSILQKIVASFGSYSDYNFTSLFSWDTEGRIMVSELNGNLVVKFTDYLDGSIFLSFIGINKVAETVRIIVPYCQSNSITTTLKLIPEDVIIKLPPKAKKDFTVNEAQGDKDYILSVQKLSEFRTNQFRGKKSAYNHFMIIHGKNCRTLEVNINAPGIKLQMEDLLLDWQRSRSKPDHEVRNEFIAIRRCLDNSRNLDVKAFATYINDKMAAFTIFELLPRKESILHFDKANTAYKGIFEYHKHKFAKHLDCLGVKTINYEQDLGLEGLRRAKLSYKPVRFLKKYTLEPISKGLDSL